MLKTLDIAPIHANTPQAKGRVERANQTLHDRLVKALRLEGFHAIEQANDFLPGFMEDYNRRFAVAPRHPEDARREVRYTPAEQEQIFCFQYQRKLSKTYLCSLTIPNTSSGMLAKATVSEERPFTVCLALDGTVTLLRKGRSLAFCTLRQSEAPNAIVDEKSVQWQVAQARQRQRQNPRWKPPVDHPWRNLRGKSANSGMSPRGHS